MKYLYSFLCLIFILATHSLMAQLTPQEAVEGMGRGINLGNTLEPPTESAWNNGPAQESYFDAYLEAGFSNIRVPVRWDQHTGNSAPFAINEAWMNRVEEVIDWGLSRGFYVTLNGHHEDWLKNNYSNATLRDRYDAIWVQVAERFKNKSDKLLFEIINEPNGMTVAEVDDLNERILGIIRQTNPTRIVIYGGNMYANSEQLFLAEIPQDDYLLAYYHAYDPWNFSGLGQGTWGTANDYQRMNNKYNAVKNWSTNNNIPVHHSEFGAVVTGDYNSRMRIYAHNVELCMTNGFAFSVWDDGGDFKVLNRGENSWPEVKDILVHYYADSPNQIFSTLTNDPVTNEPSITVDWNNRATGNGNIILEKSVGSATNFQQIASLPADATTYNDADVSTGNVYYYRMHTTREDGTLLHGYPTRLRIIGSEQTPFAGPISIPGRLEVEEYDNGGEGLAYHDTDEANIPGGFRPEEGVDIGSNGNDFILGYVASGEWIEYTVNVQTAGTYQVQAKVASQVANGFFSIDFENNNASTFFNTPNTGSWNNYLTINANTEITLEAGVQQMRLNILNNNAFNVDDLVFNITTVNVTDLAASKAGFTIAPNPTDGWVSVELTNGLQDRPAHLEVYTITGKKITSFKLNSPSMMLDFGDYESGLYLVRLVTDEVNMIHRLMVK